MGHYYDIEGFSRHETLSKSTGLSRPTTIADARKQGWFPSVTTVLDMLAKPQLDKWKQEQVALAARRALASGQLIPDDDGAYCSMVRRQAFQQVDRAADLGTRIHAAIEAYFKADEYDGELDIYVAAAVEVLTREKIKIHHHELRLVNAKLGYAGTTDGAMECPRGRGIIDFKTRKSKVGEPMQAYDGQATQIAAYHGAHYDAPPSAPDCGANVFISTTEPGRAEIVWHSGEDLASEWELWTHLVRVWQIRTGYNPSRSS